MTAEIAIINKTAVALAADSAVTLRDPSTSKIYNTANKLFMLSKFEPVGIMVYGAAEFMATPLETIIKMYRSHLGSKTFSRLNDYAQDFIRFLESNSLLFPAEKQRESFHLIVNRLFWRVRYDIDEKVKARIANAPATDEDIRQIAEQKIDEFYRNWSSVERLASVGEEFEEAIAVVYKEAIADNVGSVFEQLPVNNCIDKLTNLAAFRITRDFWPESCGLVFAGFGTLDVLPCVKSFVIETVVHNKTRFATRPRLSNDMNEKPSASIIPFARRFGVRPLMRESGVTQHPVERYLQGERVHSDTRARILAAVERLERPRN
jgi:hypothetical protein